MTYLSPGVYIEEVPSGPAPIAAVSTSVVAVIGNLRKGPVRRPTRVTGWSDFVRTFGTAHADGYTAEAIYGFFENGGPAAWVVRVDQSVEAQWTAFDVGGTASFVLAATSPGSWAGTIGVTIAPDHRGASGELYRAVVTAPVAVTATGNHQIAVASTAGLQAGDAVALGVATATAPVAATVVSFDAASITVSSTAAVALVAGSVVAGRAPAGTTTLHLPAGNGFKRGDVLAAVTPNGTRVAGVVQDVVNAGASTTLTLSTGLSADLPGAAFVQRRVAFPAVVSGLAAPTGTPPRTNIALSALSFPDGPLGPVATDFVASAPTSAVARLTAPDGRVGTWATNRFEVFGTTAPPAGAVTVEAPLFASLFTESGLSLGIPDEAAVMERYSFLPEGTAVTITGGSDDLLFTRTTTGFTLTSGTPVAGDDYTDARFTLVGDADDGVVVRSAAPLRVGDHLGFGAAFGRITEATPLGGSLYVLRFVPGVVVANLAQTRFPVMAFEAATVTAHRFELTVTVDGAAAESFAGLSLSPDHPQYYAKDDVINGASTLVTVRPRAAGAPAISAAATPFYVTPSQAGLDVAPSTADYKEGLRALEVEPEPAMVICPDTITFTDPLLQADLVGAVVGHCEKFRRFAIVDAPDLDDTALLTWRNTNLASTYAAVYAPHLMVVSIDPDSRDRFRTVPPSGFVAGVFARTDRERGVHKAPGNERVTGIVGLTQAYTQRRQDLLNPASVNLIRAFPGRGIRIWGARNATDDTTWRYVNVRRLFNSVETAVENGTQWVVFEPNTAFTWIRIRVSVENFLDQLWRSGALAGTTPEQAFRVRVGLGETMTETDVDLGLVITEVAIAPAKPAEFVVFRFSHKRLSE